MNIDNSEKKLGVKLNVGVATFTYDFTGTTMSADNFVNLPKPNLPLIIEELLPQRGMLIISGVTGVGKTYEALHLMAKIEKGEKWHGLQCHRVPCHYVMMENTKTDAINKVAKVLKSEGMKINNKITWDDQINLRLDGEEGFDNFFHLVEDAEVIFIDPVQATFRGDFNKVFSTWYRNLKRLGKTVVLLHNNRKQQILRSGVTDDSFSVDRLKDTSEFANRADSVVMIDIQKSSKNGKWVEVGRWIAVAKHRIATRKLKPLKVIWNWDDAMYEGTDWSTQDDGKDTQLEKYLKDAPPNIAAIAKEKGLL